MLYWAGGRRCGLYAGAPKTGRMCGRRERMVLPMFIASMRISRLRVCAVLLALGVVIAAAAWPRSTGRAVQAAADTHVYGVSTNEKRVSFLESYGWKVKENPVEVVEITIPQRFNAVYNRYNALQKQQGFDLSAYRGKQVKRWTYQITNYPGATGEVRANMLVYKDTVIGGDVSTVALNGFMQGFSQNPRVGADAMTPQSADITSGIFTKVVAR